MDWRNGKDGVLDAPWAADPALLPDLLPIAIAGKATALHGEHRAATFAAATDAQLHAIGIPDADIPAIRAGLDRSPHHAAHAIEGAFTRLDPHSETARAAQAELASSDPSSSYDGSGSSSPTVTRLPDGTFRVDDAEGNEIGTALDADGVQRLVEIQRAPKNGGHAPPPDPSANPFRTPDGRLPIKPQSDPATDPDLAAKEAEFLETLNRPIEEVDAAYDAIHDEFESSHGGKVISTDLPRKMLKDFAATKEGRERYTAITTTGARAYGRDRLWREIHNRGGRRKLMFTAGGIAAGKSSVVTDEVMAAQDLVYDATLRETDWAIRNIEKAIEMGWEVRIVYVQRPIELALQGAVHRAAQQGRSFPLADLPAAHRDAQRSIVEIARRFEGNPNVNVQLWLNDSISYGQPTKLSLSEIDNNGKYSYEHFSHVVDTARTPSLGRSDRERGDQRLSESSQEGGRKAVLDAFRQAIGRDDLSREVLSGLAGKDPELQRILKDSGRRSSSITPDDSTASSPDDDTPDAGTVVHERPSKARKREQDPDKKDWAKAKAIHENVLKLSSSRMSSEEYERQPRRKMLFHDKLETTPEERMILKSKYEIVLVYSKEGRLLTSALGWRTGSRIPLLAPGEISCHNHPGGRGPSALDIRFALDNPKTTMRVVTRNENGQTEIFQIRAKREVGTDEIKRIAREYEQACKDERDTPASRRTALRLIAKRHGDILEIITTIL